MTSLKVGLAWSVFDFFAFFGVPEIRESTRELLGRAMEPLLLALPAGLGLAHCPRPQGCLKTAAAQPPVVRHIAASTALPGGLASGGV